MLSYSTLQTIGDLCTLKCQAFHALADFANCHNWAILAFKSSRNVQLRTSWLEGDVTNSFLHHYFNVILTITACEYNSRGVLYDDLMGFLLTSPSSTHASSFITNAMKNIHTKLDDVLPFLEHYINR